MTDPAPAAQVASVNAMAVMPPPLPPERQVQEGVASWYGGKFHGRTTANGETFNQNALTAAHPDLPFGSKVEVTDVETDESVVVRITDRGPFTRNRVIDLSRRAADDLGIREDGLAQVQIQPLSIPD